MEEAIKKAIEDMAIRCSRGATSSVEALQFSQAANNLANTLCSLKAGK